MANIGTTYRVDITRPMQNRITRSNFLRWRSSHPVNAVGGHEVDFMLDDYLTVNNGDLVILYRDDPDNPASPHVAYTGIHRVPIETHTARRTKFNIPNQPAGYTFIRDFTSNGKQLLDIIDGAYIMYPEETPQAVKNADVVTVLSEYFGENLGVDADPLNGRYIFNNNVLITETPLPALSGVIYDGDNAEKPLLRTMQNVAAYCLNNGVPIIFEITQPDPEMYLFDFNIRYPVDRTNVGVVNGVNAAGNAPVILGLARGNVSQITRVIDFDGQKNQIVALGKGVNNDRRFRARNIPVVNAVNRRELPINGTEQETDQQLDDLADSWLESLRARERYTVVLSEANVSTWRDFHLPASPHDLVTLEFGNTEVAVAWITDVTIDISRRGNDVSESVALEVTLI